MPVTARLNIAVLQETRDTLIIQHQQYIIQLNDAIALYNIRQDSAAVNAIRRRRLNQLSRKVGHLIKTIQDINERLKELPRCTGG